METPQLYKAFRENGETIHGRPAWPLPTDDGPGDWLDPLIGDIRPCYRGYHVATLDQVLCHWMGPRLYEVEVSMRYGPLVEAEDKYVVHQARLTRKVANWNARTLRLFACDCAEHVLHMFETKYPTDTRPREAIAVTRRYADGQSTSDELNAAATAANAAANAYAAYAYAATAADAAATAAAYAAYAAYAPGAAATTAAAAYAANAAAAAAANAAAYAAEAADDYAIPQERAWQMARLRAYLDGTVTPMTDEVSK